MLHERVVRETVQTKNVLLNVYLETGPPFQNLLWNILTR